MTEQSARCNGEIQEYIDAAGHAADRDRLAWAEISSTVAKEVHQQELAGGDKRRVSGYAEEIDGDCPGS